MPLQMFLPQGRTLYKNLNTSFTSIDGLLEDLGRNRFTGYVEVQSWGYTGVLFLDEGNIVNGYQETVEDKAGSEVRTATGEAAVLSIVTKARERDGKITASRISGDMVTALVSLAKGTPVHKGLSSDFTDLGGLVSSLQKNGHSGCVEVKAADGSQGLILLLSGRVMDVVCLGSGGEEATGDEAMNGLLALGKAQGTVFNVYSSDVAACLQEVTSMDKVASARRLGEALRAVVTAVRDTLDGLLGSGKFANKFEEVQGRLTSEYPDLANLALTPEGLVIRSGAAGPELADGLCAALDQTINRLSGLFGRELLVQGLSKALEPVKNEYSDVLKAFELDKKMPDILGD